MCRYAMRPATPRYTPYADKLVGGMAKRVKLVVEKHGGNIGNCGR